MLLVLGYGSSVERLQKVGSGPLSFANHGKLLHSFQLSPAKDLQEVADGVSEEVMVE